MWLTLLSQGSMIPHSVLEAYDQQRRAREAVLAEAAAVPEETKGTPQPVPAAPL